MIQQGVTALLMASTVGYTAVVQLLLIHGAKIDIENNVYKISHMHNKFVLFSLYDTARCVSPLHRQSGGP